MQQPDRRDEFQHGENQHRTRHAEQQRQVLGPVLVLSPEAGRGGRQVNRPECRKDSGQHDDFHRAVNPPESRYELERQIRQRRGFTDGRERIAAGQQFSGLLRRDGAGRGKRADFRRLGRLGQRELPAVAVAPDQQDGADDHRTDSRARQPDGEKVPQQMDGFDSVHSSSSALSV